jgi:hypothetical protein
MEGRLCMHACILSTHTHILMLSRFSQNPNNANATLFVTVTREQSKSHNSVPFINVSACKYTNNVKRVKTCDMPHIRCLYLEPNLYE